MHARLPDGRIQETLADLKDGESAWAVPWAMQVDTNMRCYLSTGFTPHVKKGGTVDMLVRRDGNEWEVDIRESDHKYTPHDGVSGVPVARLIT